MLVVGVNGSGKTTTIGKLAKLYRDEGKTVMLAAGDTFRAAAVEQLKIWGERTGVPVMAGAAGRRCGRPRLRRAGQARRRRAPTCCSIDTAGRLHNKADLMAELQKIIRVLKKLDPAAPHDCLLVLDATTGQNALQQVETFRELVPGDRPGGDQARRHGAGGVLVALAERFKLPVHAIGVGEGADDLRPFEAAAFARSLMGLGGNAG